MPDAPDPTGLTRQDQNEEVRQLVAWAAEKTSFYPRLWGAAGVDWRDVTGVDDLVRLPTWSVDEQRASLAARPPFGEHAVHPGDELAMVISSGGTTGRPRLMPVSVGDRDRARAVMSRGIELMGVGRSDLVHITWPIGTTLAAWAFAWAAEGAGAALLPASGGRNVPSERQLDYIAHARPTVLAATATYAFHLADRARERGMDLAASSVRLVILSGETVSATTRAQLAERWGAEVADLYGNSDLLSWPAVDCRHAITTHGGEGKHVWEDWAVLETLDVDNLPTAVGELGNLTVTSWVWRSVPKIRYRTNDAVTLQRGSCPCGIDGLLMSAVAGRYDDMLKIRGVNLWPLDIEQALKGAESSVAEYVAFAERAGSEEWLAVDVETVPSSASPEELGVLLSRALNVRTKVAYVPVGSTLAITGAGERPKVRRSFDRRPEAHATEPVADTGDPQARTRARVDAQRASLQAIDVGDTPLQRRR
jgi:phenylacetate-CoA ligase